MVDKYSKMDYSKTDCCFSRACSVAATLKRDERDRGVEGETKQYKAKRTEFSIVRKTILILLCLDGNE